MIKLIEDPSRNIKKTEKRAAREASSAKRKRAKRRAEEWYVERGFDVRAHCQNVRKEPATFPKPPRPAFLLFIFPVPSTSNSVLKLARGSLSLIYTRSVNYSRRTIARSIEKPGTTLRVASARSNFVGVRVAADSLSVSPLETSRPACSASWPHTE
ncbi:hypothetical protein PUN28_012923 [Cardiocondyla obscurior]|uniref:Uncharacterized protein n=1 Tax=Cardiocondyla obscurior TaxID=286306 RepID=A0AAW2FB16_9HYME